MLSNLLALCAPFSVPFLYIIGSSKYIESLVRLLTKPSTTGARHMARMASAKTAAMNMTPTDTK